MNPYIPKVNEVINVYIRGAKVDTVMCLDGKPKPCTGSPMIVTCVRDYRTIKNGGKIFIDAIDSDDAERELYFYDWWFEKCPCQ